MAKVGICLAVREQIMLYALEAMLQALRLPVGLQVLGKSSDAAVCMQRVEELFPAFVLLDQDMCAEDGSFLRDIFSEHYPKMTQILLLTSREDKNRLQALKGENQLLLLKTEVCEETLAALMKQALRERSGRNTRNRIQENPVIWAGIHMGHASVEYKKAKYLYDTIRKELLEKGYQCGRETQKRGFLLFAVETIFGRKREFQLDLRKIVEAVNREHFGNPVFVSEMRSKGEWTETRLKHFEEKLYHAGFYGIGTDVSLEDWDVGMRTFWREEFPHTYYKKLLEKADFSQAAKLLKLYLKQAQDEYLDCDLVRVTILEAGLRFLKYTEGEQSQECFYDLKHKILDAENFEALRRICEEEICVSMQRKPPAKGDLEMETILAYIRTNYFEPLTLAEIAKTFNYNYSYLSTAFSRYTGQSFAEYLNQIRIEQACCILEKPKVQVAMVADVLGYSSAGYFSKIFKKYKGCTPKEYQKEWATVKNLKR